ncbi:hypothetical protein [Clostridium estertheticum]|uniref:hypothetical protein n=1 Tax=Clostridium estertheticum TaxID=238834 RepID=UPI001CF5AF34|nr:hypothetical protein [Clostridium estertheticum]MCB2342613.1 hypothetical protein [Clostridium estertheticum]
MDSLAVSAGNAMISVVTTDGQNLTCNVTVFNPGPGRMVITNSLIDFVANYEGYSAKPYGGVDSQNHTIGYV